MGANRSVKKHEILGVTVYEVPPEDEARTRRHQARDVNVENPANPRNPRTRTRPPVEKEEPAAPTWVTVAKGALVIASDRRIIEKVLAERTVDASLAQDATYARVSAQVQAEMQRRNWQGLCFHTFERTDRVFEAAYESARLSILPKSQSLLGKMMKAWSEAQTGEEGVKPKKIDLSKLPPFDSTRHRLGPSAWFGVSEPDGFFAVSFTLKADGPLAGTDTTRR
jgi:hypothetical protein